MTLDVRMLRIVLKVHEIKVDQLQAQDVATSPPEISPIRRPKKYDVFISFRGEDTRNNFTSHLHAALDRKKLKIYIDNRLDKGGEISSALIEAIKESYISLIVFSENYASSKWCLDELIEIIECKKLGHVVIPVFYKIDPSLARKQLRSYKKAFVKHERDLKHNMDKVLKWKTALTEAANLAGFDSLCYRTDNELIKEIVKEVEKKVYHLYPNNEFKGLVGFHQNIAHMETLLAINSNDVRIIGIWGMGGIGKTTLAKALFAKYLSQYESSCFLKHVREESTKHGLDRLHHQLLSELLGEDNHEIWTHGITLSFVKRRLSSKKVFIVLDDVNSLEQLQCLVEKHSLGLGSRVILTTRDKHMFGRGIDGYHEVKRLNFKDSLQLFSLNTFNESHHKMKHEEHSIRAVDYAKGVPLALKVLGSFLHSKSEEEWESTLRKLEKIPNKTIQSVLRLSYDELDHEEQKIFLDIACFMKGWNKNRVKEVLDGCGFFADIGMRNLVDKALITIAYDNKVEMHDLIQEMGREIVRQESIENPERRSRLWDSEEVYLVLRNNKGTDAIEGMVLDAYEFGDLHLEPDIFKKMIKLKFLKLGGHRNKKFNLCIPSNLESLPNHLCYLEWVGYPLKSLPSTFHPEKLVVLDMRYSQVEKLWDGIQNLANLEEIWLSGSQNLLELPNWSRATNLRKVYLKRCTRLRDVHSSILSLPKLEVLYLDDCKALKSLKSNIHLTSLRFLSARGCMSLQDFSVTSENMMILDLAFTAIDELPSSVLLLKKLESFVFRVSESINKLPDKFVKSLYLLDCCQRDLSTLRNVLDSLWYLKELSLPNCTFSELPDNIFNQLVSLQLLSLCGSCNLMRLPGSMKHLSQLSYIDLSWCEKLQSLPELPPSITFLDAGNCNSLEILFGLSDPPKKLNQAHFLFENCIKLGQHALDTIMADVVMRIKIAANYLFSALATEDQEQEKCAEIYGEEYSKICFCLPGNKLPDWFSYCSIQPSLTIEIPSCYKFLGFAFYVIIPEGGTMGKTVDLGCECCYVGNNGETIISFESWFCKEERSYLVEDELASDHVYIWYDARHYHQIISTIEHNRTSCNMKFSFTFLVKVECAWTVEGFVEGSHVKKGIEMEIMITSCGVQPIYVTENHLTIGEGSTTFNRSVESDELESLPKITRKAIFPAHSSGNWKREESRGLKEILFLDC